MNGTPFESFPLRGIQTGADLRLWLTSLSAEVRINSAAMSRRSCGKHLFCHSEYHLQVFTSDQYRPRPKAFFFILEWSNENSIRKLLIAYSLREELRREARGPSS